MVSPRIVSYSDYKAAQVSSSDSDGYWCHDYLQACYQQLYTAGMKGYLRYAPNYYQYSHQKFWIVDNTTVHLSTGTCVYVRACACVVWTEHCMCTDKVDSIPIVVIFKISAVTVDCPLAFQPFIPY